MRAIDGNFIEQALTLRRHYLPNENDSTENLARAIWLDNRYWENNAISVANGISLAFKGE
ncbi:hypothetical protein EGO53_26935 [Serratia liquefaciens]|uniref:Uncharacterized protein n=1 Tax=Serratia liquefaciens TaxID=614 RepID=A0A515CRB0_SERLI|nr:hypothetical protein EGO53_01975 [Serratia liquefaciens]QDL35182.1 hypothetical protein EGO53_26935 [Serratia liquefaciens]